MQTQSSPRSSIFSSLSLRLALGAIALAVILPGGLALRRVLGLGEGPRLHFELSGSGALAAPLEGALKLEASWTPGPPIQLSQVGAGELLWRRPEGWVPLPVLDTEVELDTLGMLLRGTVTQSFRNGASEPIVATYVFPLPEGAAVHAMELRVGERRIVAQIAEKREARRQFEQAAREGRRAALVEESRPNLFRTSVANVQPGETVRVRLEYVEELAYADGEYSLAVPLTFTPRFTPPAPGGEGAALPAADAGARFVPAQRAEVPRAKINVRLRPGLPVEDLRSGSHALDIRKVSEGYELSPMGGSVAADRDFLLSWRPQRGQEPGAALFTEEREGERFGLLLLVPPAVASEAGRGLPTETVFVVDVSGSMDGPSVRQARVALEAALRRLRPEDRFAILRFNDESSWYRERFTVAEPAEVDEAAEWVRQLRADGGTMIQPALMRALELLHRAGDAERVQRVVFLTDGAVSNEAELFASIQRELGDARLHTIGIGAAPNRYLMRKMATFGRGRCAFVSAEADSDNRIDQFFASIDRPVLESPTLSWQGGQVLDLNPSPLPDLHAGESLLLSFRLGPQAPAALRLHGRQRSGPVALDLRLPQPTLGSVGVGLRWARNRIDGLLDGLSEGVAEDQVRPAVVDLALRFHLVTRYTSLVAVEERPAGPPAERSEAVANGLPPGGDQADADLPMGGTDGPLHTLLGLLLALAAAAVFVSPRLLRGRQ